MFPLDSLSCFSRAVAGSRGAGRRRGKPQEGRKARDGPPPPPPAPHVTPLTDDSATWKGLEASVLRWQDECVTWARALGPHWVTSRVTCAVSMLFPLEAKPSDRGVGEARDHRLTPTSSTSPRGRYLGPNLGRVGGGGALNPGILCSAPPPGLPVPLQPVQRPLLSSVCCPQPGPLLPAASPHRFRPAALPQAIRLSTSPGLAMLGSLSLLIEFPVFQNCPHPGPWAWPLPFHSPVCPGPVCPSQMVAGLGTATPSFGICLAILSCVVAAESWPFSGPQLPPQ